MDANTAALNAWEIRQSELSREANRKTKYVESEVLKAERNVTSFVISDLFEDDEEFANDLCLAVAKLIRDPRNLGNAAAVLSAFQSAIEREAEKEYTEYEEAA